MGGGSEGEVGTGRGRSEGKGYMYSGREVEGLEREGGGGARAGGRQRNRS